eukprot:GHVH01007321.1.p2 GENE.GHVH01007321.1~~GHVH01007321.1.p2  ORF type:complete len:370 (-),score=42.38 GHVH01007321.1:1368-2477(-)
MGLTSLTMSDMAVETTKPESKFKGFNVDRCIEKIVGSADNKLRLSGGKRDRNLIPRNDGIFSDVATICTDSTQFEFPELLLKEEIFEIANIAQEMLRKEETCVSVPAPVTIAGDIHGQLFDLFELLCISGKPPETNLLFLGDYVDRGYYSIESICLVLLYKLKYPQRVTVLRGNHETRQITQVYGFYDECVRKYGDAQVWTKLMLTFDCLPLSALIDGYIFCDHGGLSPTLNTIDKIKAEDRFKDVPYDDPLADLLWSDPDTMPGWSLSSRGAGYQWGEDISEIFCNDNGVQFICRAHQMVQEGYQLTHSNRIATVFSAPNYCYRCGNKASICEIYENQADGPPLFVQFESAPKRSTLKPLQQPPDYFV